VLCVMSTCLQCLRPALSVAALWRLRRFSATASCVKCCHRVLSTCGMTSAAHLTEYQCCAFAARTTRCKGSSGQACYVKGKLQPTRSLGDAYLKYSEFNGTAGQHSSAGRFIAPPYTPPYITADPEVRFEVRQTGSNSPICIYCL
jgi:hypothetical protein